MLPEPSDRDSTTTGGENQKQLDREIREMMSALTRRLADLQHVQKQDGTRRADEDDDYDHGIRIITLAGSNVGATMRSEIDEKPSHDHQDGEHEPLTTYLNSNFQAVNNSVMLGGSYSTNDPGIHMDVSEYFHKQPQKDKHGRKGKKKYEGSSKSDLQGSD